MTHTTTQQHSTKIKDKDNNTTDFKIPMTYTPRHPDLRVVDSGAGAPPSDRVPSC